VKANFQFVILAIIGISALPAVIEFVRLRKMAVAAESKES